jgi:hypothetical protein
MANELGHAASLEPYREGNRHAVRHGLYSSSGRVLAPRAEEIADALMEAAHAVPLDRLAAEEIGALLARIEALDAELDRRGPGGKGAATLLDLRLRASGRLERWLREFGATPATRADWAARLAHGGLAEEIRRRRDALRGEEANGA